MADIKQLKAGGVEILPKTSASAVSFADGSVGEKLTAILSRLDVLEADVAALKGGSTGGETSTDAGGGGGGNVGPGTGPSQGGGNGNQPNEPENGQGGGHGNPDDDNGND